MQLSLYSLSILRPSLAPSRKGSDVTCRATILRIVCRYRKHKSRAHPDVWKSWKCQFCNASYYSLSAEPEHVDDPTAADLKRAIEAHDCVNGTSNHD